MGPRQGEEEFDAVFRQHYRLVLTTAERRLGDFATAEDVTAEVFRIAWQHYQRGGVVSLAWLYAVVRNVVGNEYRRSRRTAALAERVGLAEAFPIPTDVDLVIDVRRAMERLDPLEGEILRMAYWDDLDGGEIAQVLHISRTAARTRLMRARRALAAILSMSMPRGTGGSVKEVAQDG